MRVLIFAVPNVRDQIAIVESLENYHHRFLDRQLLQKSPPIPLAMLGNLPLEIQVQILQYAPSSSLKHTNSHFYILYNHLHYNKIVCTFGEDIVDVLIKILPWIKTYVKSLDAFRHVSRKIIASRLKLQETNDLDSLFIKDSWRYIYSVLFNRRLFAEYSDYKIDEPSNYVFNHFVEINRTYLLSYEKTIWLAPGHYNLNIGLVVKHGSGLGTTKFEFSYDTTEGKVKQTLYPPTNINDILPKLQFCLLRLGEFTIPPTPAGSPHHSNLFKFNLVMEEIGLYLKSGFRIFFIDISQPSLLFNDYDLLYYAINETDYKYFINLPLKNLYKALNHVQNGNSSGVYGSGNPYKIMDQYDQNYLIAPGVITLDDDTNNDSSGIVESHDRNPIAMIRLHTASPVGEVESDESDDTLPGGSNHSEYRQDYDRLMKYADFYYNNHFKMRYFKFNTVYQRRQFINRFGDFELDWKEVKEIRPAISRANSTNGVPLAADKPRSCMYDREGLKWKIPLVGSL